MLTLRDRSDTGARGYCKQAPPPGYDEDEGEGGGAVEVVYRQQQQQHHHPPPGKRAGPGAAAGAPILCPFASDLPEPAGRAARPPQFPCCAGFSFLNRKKPARCKREACQDLVWCSDDCRASFVSSWAFLMAVGTETDRAVQEGLFRSIAAWRAARPGSERAERLRELNWAVLAFTTATEAVWRNSIDQAAGPERSVWNLLFSPDSTRALLDKIAAHRADMERAMHDLMRM